MHIVAEKISVSKSAPTSIFFVKYLDQKMHRCRGHLTDSAAGHPGARHNVHEAT
jgi:hypothetical protein